MNLQHDMLDSRSPRDRFIYTANVLITFIDFLCKYGGAITSPSSDPRSVEVALMQDITNAFVSVISEGEKR